VGLDTRGNLCAVWLGGFSSFARHWCPFFLQSLELKQAGASKELGPNLGLALVFGRIASKYFERLFE